MFKHIIFLTCIIIAQTTHIFSQDNDEFVYIGHGPYTKENKYKLKQKGSTQYQFLFGYLKSHQDSIQLKIGLSFGLQFSINSKNENNSTTHIKVKWVLPDKMKAEGQLGESNVILYDVAVTNNEPSIIGLTLTGEEDLIPGNWVLYITYGPDKEYVQNFYLYK